MAARPATTSASATASDFRPGRQAGAENKKLEKPPSGGFFYARRGCAGGLAPARYGTVRRPRPPARAQRAVRATCLYAPSRPGMPFRVSPRVGTGIALLASTAAARHPMLAFILRRMLQAVVVMVVVAFIAFLLFQYVGDPVVFLLGQDAKPAQIRELRSGLGLDQPFFVQFWHFLGNAVQGEFGLSLRQGAKVSRLIGERFPATLELSLVAALLALLVGIPMGVYTALRRGTFMSQVFMTVSLLGVSLPTFLIGILLILVFAVTLGWFPSFGRGDTVQFGWWTSGLFKADGWHHIILPAVTLAIFQLTLIMRLVRAE